MAARYPRCAVLMWLHGVVRRRYVAAMVSHEEESGRVHSYILIFKLHLGRQWQCYFSNLYACFSCCYSVQFRLNQWRNRQGGKGQSAPKTSDREISADLPGKKRQGKKGKGVKIEKKRRKNVKWKVEKLQNEERTFFIFFYLFIYLFIYFFFCFSLFKTTTIRFWSTKMEIFYQEKAFHTWKKKNQEK